jgi:hypothetical protein
MAAFKHHKLVAISFNNVENRSRIQDILKSKDYERTSPLAFIQSSDYHGNLSSDIGSLFTKVKFGNSKVNFEGLCESLSCEDNIICFSDIISDIYNDMTSDWDVARFTTNIKPEIAVSDYRSIADVACAFVNSEGGIIEISINNMNIDKRASIVQSCKDNIDSIIADKLKPDLGKTSVKSVPVSNSRLIILYYIWRSNRLHSSDGRVYIYDGGPREATISEIEFLVTKNVCNKFDKTEALAGMSLNAKKLSKTYKGYPIAIKIQDKVSFATEGLFKLTNNPPSGEVSDATKKHLANNINGAVDGNTILAPTEFQGSRNETSYYRFTSLTHSFGDNSTCKLLTDDQILLHMGGGSNIAYKNKYLCNPTPCISLTFEKTDYILPCLAWLKSTFALWYVSIIGSNDLYFSFMFDDHSIPFPNKDILDTIREPLTKICEIIIADEYCFLKEIGLIADDDEACNKVIDFNNKMNASMLQLDKIIFDALSLSKSEQQDIYESIQDIGLYTFK